MRYLIVDENGYDGYDVILCEDKKELQRMLMSTDGYHRSFDVQEIEVYAVVGNELSHAELMNIRDEI